ncbi:diadenylate cyclase CdaA [Thermocrinis minervae]|uniref:Diadenylate cyclase n=1 Tax=Thermocrinis minervae TaxID=381751 RepID=A0A1M6R109_9AQUI|nr:diadenylate cyclase CdaA [Thermocrinis minervae]SHK26124.1 TIGR00159 family protein [Thermocrinis minervae]
MEIFKYISPKDFLDIFLLSILIYGVLYFLKITKGFQILLGFIPLVGMWVLAEVFNLRALKWIFEKLWTVGLFSLIIIFQPEIRKALMQLGHKTRIKTTKPVEEMVIEKVVRACFFMAERQIGALIVIERGQNLEFLIEGCVYIDSAVSVELLITIFNPLSPLHDGAVVIRGDRIAYASCILPLSKSPNIPKKYGTRHRAAVGITEESDAIAIVVSEETGEVSIAVSGKLERNLDPETAKGILFRELGMSNA